MQIYPAIDLRGGYCVRLRQGDYDQETIFDNDPPPNLSIGDCVAVEPLTGAVEARFPLFLDRPSGLPVAVAFQTADGTALEQV